MALAEKDMIAGPHAVIVRLFGPPMIVPMVMVVIMAMMVVTIVVVAVTMIVQGVPVMGMIVRHGRKSSVLPL